MLAPLAGPANKQARVAADALCGIPSVYRGTLRTSICSVFGLGVASSGLPAETRGLITVHVHASDHAGFLPGARALHLNLSFDLVSGRVMCAQGVGERGVDKRVDVLAMAMRLGGTVSDVAQTECCYAPQFGAARDVVNLAGMVAENIWRILMVSVDWSVALREDSVKIDVRDEEAFRVGSKRVCHL